MKNLVYILILSVMLITMMIGCMSCGRVVKEVTKTNTVVDSTAVKEKDSIIQVKQSTISRLESELRETQYSGVVFNNVDTGCYVTTPFQNPCPENKVTIKADGSIEASGNIKSANVTKDKYQKTIADWEKKYDSLYKVKTKDSTTVKTVTNTVTKFKDRGIPGWLLILYRISLLLAFIAGFYVRHKLDKLFEERKER